ncbi:MAG: anti-sigma factor [Candidatus Acidiferrales bacterium]
MKSLLAVALMLAIWPMSSGKKYHMTADNSVPAASGVVDVQTDKSNGNMKLDIKVANLAQPSNLTPTENVYVVWIRPSGENAHKQGTLGVDGDLKGELKVITTSKNFDVFITAEQSGSVTEPSGVEVLQTHVSQ